MPQQPVISADKICVGPVDYSFIPIIPSIPGSTVLNGPVWIGVGIPIPTANCMIRPGLFQPISLEVVGIANFLSITNQIGISNRLGLANIFGFTIKIGASLKAAFAASFGVSTKAAVQITHGPKFCSALAMAPLVKASVINAPVLNGRATGNKSFDIPHPTKDGWRLRHTCLEGPSNDIYFRGRINNEEEINLPEYWRNLVDINSITVSLTPVGYVQEVIVKEIKDNKIILQSNGKTPIDCFFHIFGERNDGEKLIIEYSGNSAADYPGNNEQYSVAGYHYDTRLI